MIAALAALLEALRPLHPHLLGLVILVIAGFALRPAIDRLPFDEATRRRIKRPLGWAHNAAIAVLGLTALSVFGLIAIGGAAINDAGPL